MDKNQNNEGTRKHQKPPKFAGITGASTIQVRRRGVGQGDHLWTTIHQVLYSHRDLRGSFCFHMGSCSFVAPVAASFSTKTALDLSQRLWDSFSLLRGTLNHGLGATFSLYKDSFLNRSSLFQDSHGFCRNGCMGGSGPASVMDSGTTLVMGSGPASASVGAVPAAGSEAASASTGKGAARGSGTVLAAKVTTFGCRGLELCYRGHCLSCRSYSLSRMGYSLSRGNYCPYYNVTIYTGDHSCKNMVRLGMVISAMIRAGMVIGDAVRTGRRFLPSYIHKQPLEIQYEAVNRICAFYNKEAAVPPL